MLFGNVSHSIVNKILFKINILRRVYNSARGSPDYRFFILLMLFPHENGKPYGL